MYQEDFYAEFQGRINRESHLGWLYLVREVIDAASLYTQTRQSLSFMAAELCGEILDTIKAYRFAEDTDNIQLRLGKYLKVRFAIHISETPLSSSYEDYEDYRQLVQRMIGFTILYAYSKYREQSASFFTSGWENADTVIIRSLQRHIGTENAEQQALLHQVRDLYISRWQHAQQLVAKIPGRQGRFLRKTMSRISQTYLYGLRCISDDFRQRRPPSNFQNFIGFLLLPWAFYSV